MNKQIIRIVLLLGVFSVWVQYGLAKQIDMTFYGLADASAAVFLDSRHFVVADDESNILRTYSIDKTEGPVSTLNLDKFLDVDPDSPEVDIEAAARVGDRIYWISSHGRNKSGKIRTSRYRFFCTEIITGKSNKHSVPILKPLGKPCKTLMHQFVKHPSFAQRLLISTKQFSDNLKKKQRQKLAPKKDGLNIEGLMYYKPNKSLLIGLRNPLLRSESKQNSNAIIIELLNPDEVIENSANAKFGKVLNWNLNNRGIRAMQHHEVSGTYFLVAGPIDSETGFAMYQWDGKLYNNPKLKYLLPQTDSQFKPEAIAIQPNANSLWLFSDDGTLTIPVNSPSECKEGELLKNDKCPNKYLTDSSRKTFRAKLISP